MRALFESRFFGQLLFWTAAAVLLSGRPFELILGVP